MTHRPNPLPDRPPTDAELRAMAKAKPTADELDAMLETTAKLWAVPGVKWRRIAAELSRKP